MGNVRFGIPEDIVLYIKELTGIELFVETGTFRGATSYWASKYFKTVKTIEFSEGIYNETKDKYSDLLNVEFIYGDSRDELRKIMDISSENAIIWLDAHWCSFDTFGETDQCPLLEELEIIFSNKAKHIILIDDARLFLCPPPLPHSVIYYPSISEIISKLIDSGYHTIICDDVIVCVPITYKDALVNYMQQKVTMEDVGNAARMIRYKHVKTIARFVKKIIHYK